MPGVEKYAVIDIETTGGRANRDRITEVAIVLHDGEKILDSFESLINPETYIPPSITELTGITNEMVAEAPKFYEVAKTIVEMTEGAVFVAHSVRFDYGFIREEFRRLGFTYSRKQLCTVRLSRQVFPGLKSYSLGNLIRHFKIEVNDRHRAMADTLATVNLFERIMAQQNGQDKSDELINLGIKETKLPEGITLEYLHALPDECGVYYFYNGKGEVLYVGKSINIRKRVMEHFTDQTRKAATLHEHTREISYEITGSELIALLKESEEIKKLRPPVNRAQRQREFPYIIHQYQNSEGYTCFEIQKPRKKLRKSLEVLNEYPKISHARGALTRVKEEFELCSKYLGLEPPGGACFNFHIKKCEGACVGKEAAASYNERAAQASDYLSNQLIDNLIIEDEGRNPREASVVVVEDGELKGYGYFDLDNYSAQSIDDLKSIIQPAPTNPEVRRIIIRFLAGKKNIKVTRF